MGGSDGTLRRLGDFVLEDETGRGGMGIVYRARQTSAGGRLVALKVLPSLIGCDQAAVSRFRREAEAAGRLAHPGIVPVYAVGEEQGVHYFAMEFVDGPSLESLVDAVSDQPPDRLLGTLFEESGFDQVFPLMADSDVRSSGASNRYSRSCARLAADIAAALSHAHRAGVIHRDVKPSNVLLRASAQPVLVDFGLARDERSLGLTQSGDAIGTPSYMAPEQACGQRECDGRTDVYGLGATLYEMLTLRPPFAGAHPGEIMRRIVEDDPAPIRGINPRVPDDLSRIVACCLEKDPDARYPTMDALEADLRCFLEGRPVLARAASRTRRLRQLVARHRRGATVALIVSMATSVAFVAAGVIAGRAAQQAADRALAEARDFVRNDLRIGFAEEAYGRARALLGDPPVLEARKLHLVTCFDELYARGLHEELLRYLDLEWSASFRDEAWWQELRVRAEGRGAIPLAPLPPGTEVRLRHFSRERGIEPIARPWIDSELLPLGDWLVEVEAPGMTPIVHAYRVDRAPQLALVPAEAHFPTALVPLLRPLGTVGADEVLVPGTRPGEGIAIRRTETTEREYAELMAQIPDSRLRRELTPDPSAGRAATPLDPVRGLSWRAGRSYAIAAGAHVPSQAEYLQAATAGLDGLPYPWGSVFAWDRVAASPTGALPGPLPAADETRAGASLHGVLHLVGNVAELIAPEPGQFRARAVGGSFKDDDPARLRVDAWDELRPGESSRVLGVRLARFVPPPDDPASAQRAVELLLAARNEWPRAAVHEWEVRRDGQVDWRLFRAGQSLPPSPDGRFRLALATPGFHLVDAVPLDAQDRPVGHNTLRMGTDFRELSLDLPTRAGDRWRVAVRGRLRPRTGLFAHGAHHHLRIPLAAAGGPRTVHVLRLPSGCRIDQVEPRPGILFHEGGAPVLLWDLPSGTTMRSASVVFRIDGSLATPWPSFEEGRAAFEALLQALAATGPKRAGALEGILDVGFVLGPQGAQRPELVADTVPGSRFEADPTSIEDVTGIGSTVSVFARVTWVGPNGDRVRRWPVHAMFVRTEQGLRAVALGPRIEVDGGRFDGRTYVHDELGARLTVPDGVTAQRDAAGPWHLQLHVREAQPPAGATAWIDLRGLRAPTEPNAEMTELEALDWLTAGASFTTDDGRIDLTRATRDPLWPDLMTLRFDTLRLTAAGGAARRERWHLVERGYRWFLLRCVAVGATEQQAIEGFRRAEAALFEPVIAGLDLSGVEPGSGPR